MTALACRAPRAHGTPWPRWSGEILAQGASEQQSVETASRERLPELTRLINGYTVSQAIYVMANLVVFGAEVNWWQARRRTEAVRPPFHANAG